MSAITTQEFFLEHHAAGGREGEYLTADVRYIDDGRPKPLVIAAHGFKTYKDYGMFPHMGELLAGGNFVSVVLNFARNGVKRGKMRIEDWDGFGRNTPTCEIEDLHLLLDAIGDGALDYFGIDVYDQPLSLVGHSGGGSICLITASERSEVTSVVSLSSVSTFDRFSEEEKSNWRKKGHFEFARDEDVGVVTVGVEALDDIEHNGDRLNIPEKTGALRIPVLFVHGTGDKTVPPEEARLLRESSTHPKSGLMLIEGADHLYNTKHPYERGSSEIFESMMRDCMDWLNSL